MILRLEDEVSLTLFTSWKKQATCCRCCDPGIEVVILPCEYVQVKIDVPSTNNKPKTTALS